MAEQVANKKDVVVRVENLTKQFSLKYSIIDAITRKPRKTLKAVDSVSFEILRGETLGLVGESGCGKSTLARTMLRLYEPNGGEIFYGDLNATKIKGKELRKQRQRFQMIFQDPFSSLNPRKTVRMVLAEVFKVHKVCARKDVERRVYELLQMVGLGKSAIDRFPGEFSGGQRQRIGVARALSINPDFIIADEPVSALDVSIQAQIINLLSEIQEKKQLSFLFISHDLRVVRLVTHRVAVMYLGAFVELSPTEALFKHPYHPYTKVLMQAAPVLDPTNRTREYAIEGEPPSPVNLPSGCRFHPRCVYATEECKTTEPEFLEIEPGRFVACHHPL